PQGDWLTTFQARCLDSVSALGCLRLERSLGGSSSFSGLSTCTAPSNMALVRTRRKQPSSSGGRRRAVHVHVRRRGGRDADIGDVLHLGGRRSDMVVLSRGYARARACWW